MNSQEYYYQRDCFGAKYPSIPKDMIHQIWRDAWRNNERIGHISVAAECMAESYMSGKLDTPSALELWVMAGYTEQSFTDPDQCNQLVKTAIINIAEELVMKAKAAVTNCDSN